MDLRLFFSVFCTIFLAELGDKTQLTALSLSASGASRPLVLVASSLALIASTSLAVLGGEWLVGIVPLVWVQRAAGLGFCGLGLMTLWQARSA